MIVDPVVLGGVLAVVTSPIVTWLKRVGVPRAGGAALVLLGLVAVAVLILLLVLGGLTAHSGEIKTNVSGGVDRVQSWLEDAGATGTGGATQDVKSDVPEIGRTLLQGVAAGISGLTSLAFFLSFTMLATFFLLKDGPSARRWVDRNLSLPLPVARTITSNMLNALRRYFLGVTLVAAFNGVVVGLASLALGVPLAGTIGVVTFITAYVPYIGAFIAGAFAVLLALGAKGTTTALIMLVVVILANGLLQNIFQPIAFGATLDLHPLIVLVVTISAGALFGMLGLVLAAPLTSAAVHIARDLRRAKGTAELPAEEASPPPALAAPSL